MQTGADDAWQRGEKVKNRPTKRRVCNIGQRERQKGCIIELGTIFLRTNGNATKGKRNEVITSIILRWDRKESLFFLLLFFFPTFSFVFLFRYVTDAIEFSIYPMRGYGVGRRIMHNSD